MTSGCGNKTENVQFDLPENASVSDLPYYPCRLKDNTGNNSFAVLIYKSEMVQYADVFKQFGYYGNGISWEELCRTIIKLENKKLLDQITFETNEVQSTMIFNSKDLQQQVANIIHGWTTDKEKLRTAFSEVNSIYME